MVDRKLLQDAQTSLSWEAVEQYLNEYVQDKLDLTQSAKRTTEADIIWDRAFTEGGIFYLKDFFRSIEQEARKYNGV